MQTQHSGAHQPHDANWIPTIGLAWFHFAIALFCAFLAFTGIAPPMLAIFFMAVFGVIAVLCVILTVTR